MNNTDKEVQIIHDDTPLIPLGLSILCFFISLSQVSELISIIFFCLTCVFIYWFYKALEQKKINEEYPRLGDTEK